MNLIIVLSNKRFIVFRSRFLVRLSTNATSKKFISMNDAYLTFCVLVSIATIEGFSEILERQENATDLLNTPFQIGIRIR